MTKRKIPPFLRWYEEIWLGTIIGVAFVAIAVVTLSGAVAQRLSYCMTRSRHTS
jgi:hypothetical protein